MGRASDPYSLTRARPDRGARFVKFRRTLLAERNVPAGGWGEGVRGARIHLSMDVGYIGLHTQGSHGIDGRPFRYELLRFPGGRKALFWKARKAGNPWKPLI